MSTLDADQCGCVEALGKAIVHGSTQVIKAGAGSGKTHTIAHAISTYPGALAISHTRVACETLRERVLHPGTAFAFSRFMPSRIDSLAPASR